MHTSKERTTTVVTPDLESTIFSIAQALEPVGVSHLWGEYEGSNERATIEKLYASFNGAAYFLIAQKELNGACNLLNPNTHGNPKILACFKHLNRLNAEGYESKMGQSLSVLQYIELAFSQACKQLKIDFKANAPLGDFHLELKSLTIEQM